MWVTSWPRRTDKVKAPGFEEESRARKEPSKPRSRSSDSASTPEMAWWNHLEREKISNQWFIVRRRSHASLHSAPLGNKEMLSRENIKRVTPMLIHFMRLQLMAFFQPDTESSLGNKFFILFYKLSSSSANERRGREWESCDGIFFIFFFSKQELKGREWTTFASHCNRRPNTAQRNGKSEKSMLQTLIQLLHISDAGLQTRNNFTSFGGSDYLGVGKKVHKLFFSQAFLGGNKQSGHLRGSFGDGDARYLISRARNDWLSP